MSLKPRLSPTPQLDGGTHASISMYHAQYSAGEHRR